MAPWALLIEITSLKNHISAIEDKVRQDMYQQEMLAALEKNVYPVGAQAVWQGSKRKPGEHTKGTLILFDERVHRHWRGVFGYFHTQPVVISPRGYRISPFSQEWGLV